MTSGVEANIENSGDSARSPASVADEYDLKGGSGAGYGAKYAPPKGYDPAATGAGAVVAGGSGAQAAAMPTANNGGGGGAYENNGDVKFSKGVMLGGSPAELYYKQLLAANVAALGKAAKIGFNANLYPGREEKRPGTPDDETGSASSNDESGPMENDGLNQVYWRGCRVWCRNLDLLLRIVFNGLLLCVLLVFFGKFTIDPSDATLQNQCCLL